MSTEGNSSFSQKSQNLQLAWDSTSLGLLKECPRKYYYSIVLGYQGSGDNVHLAFGQLYHGALERYDHSRATGADHDAATVSAVRYCLTETRVALANGGWRPRDWGDSNKNRFTLVRTVVWYLEQFRDDPARTLILHTGKPAVELSFRFETDFKSLAGETFWLCGHLDRVVEFNNAVYGLDRKTTKHTLYSDFIEEYSPDNQMSLYDIALQVVYGIRGQGIIVDKAQIAVGFSRFERGFLPKTDEQRVEFYADTAFWIGQAELFARKNYWPMNDKACGNFGGCVFRGICARSPQVREMWLKGLYTKRMWDPLQVRGDI